MAKSGSHPNHDVGKSGPDTLLEPDSPPAPENAFTPAEVEGTHAAYVRYLQHEDGEFRQGRLSLVGQHIPDDAVAVSTGVYFLTPDQEDRLHDGCPSKQLQDECNEDGRVAYAIVVESDALEDKKEVSTVIDWLSTFAEDWMGIDEYSFYYSGRRSIHLHTEKHVGAEEINDLRLLASEFNATHDADLDTSIYQPNSQFRLIGAEHRKTGLYKVPIPAEADRADCIKAAHHPPERQHWPYDLPEPRHHRESEREAKGGDLSNLTSKTHYRPGSGDIVALPPEIEGQVLRGVYKDGNSDLARSGHGGSQYAHPFSPYKKTGDDSARSVIVGEQIGGIRQKLWTEDIYVPVKIEYAIGGGDGSFTRSQSESLVELSPRDYRKWQFEEGDQLVIIGGNSGSSRLFDVDETTARIVATALESSGRGKALEVLSNRGFEVGSAGYNSSQFHDAGSAEAESKAAELKRGIENGSRERSYHNVFRVVCRLLRTDGWDAAYSWCRDIFGMEFDPKQTYEILEGIVETYDDYSHVRIPDGPEED